MQSYEGPEAMPTWREDEGEEWLKEAGPSAALDPGPAGLGLMSTPCLSLPLSELLLSPHFLEPRKYLAYPPSLQGHPCPPHPASAWTISPHPQTPPGDQKGELTTCEGLTALGGVSVSFPLLLPCSSPASPLLTKDSLPLWAFEGPWAPESEFSICKKK